MIAWVRVDNYRLVGMATRLNRTPRDFPNIVAYASRARFSEVVSGIPILAEVELTNTFRSGIAMVVATGRMTSVRWLEPATRDRGPPTAAALQSALQRGGRPRRSSVRM